MADEVKTKNVARRKLWFNSIDELLVELDRIEKADKEGKLKTVGNWTAGQILAHLSAWIEYGWVGYPISSPPFFIKWILVRMGRRYIKKGMPAGARIPGVDGGTKGQDKISTAEGLARLRAAYKRLQNGEKAKFDSPGFGPLSEADRILLNLRHAELHLGFLSF